MRENKICGFNLSQETVGYLNRSEIAVYPGSLGKVVRLVYGPYVNSVRVHPQADLPKNLHEYAKIIIDLTTETVVDYVYDDHVRKNNKSHRDAYMVCHYPQNIYDPSAFVLGQLKGDLTNALEQGALLVVFCGKNEKIEYHFNVDGNDSKDETDFYSFLPTIPNVFNRHGELIKSAKGNSEVNRFLSRFCSQSSYHVTFQHPSAYIDGKYVDDPTFFPLMCSHDDEIVSFCSLGEKSGVFFFPDIQDKGAFLTEFFTNIAPGIVPELFPGQVKDKWLEEKRYSLPNHERLLSERDALLAEFERQVIAKDAEIDVNKLEYGFLKDLLIEWNKPLVSAVVTFLKWLGFDSAVDADSLKAEGETLEEDIQVETDRGLIIIEVKGIGGTSTDADCSQIGKIRFRRAKQRGNFDVFPLYIVNHQRHIPAEKRLNPPFSENQISDAENDHRGMMTTWQLFNLFALIEKGGLGKEEVRESFFESGYIDFIPKSKKSLGTPKQYYKNNTVVIIDMEDEPKVRVDDQLLIVHKGEFTVANVLSVQQHDQDISESAAGEVGLMLDIPVGKGSVLYV